MNVFVTGATGFVGRQLCAALSRAGHGVIALVRKGSEAKLPQSDSITPVSGDLFSPTLPGLLDGCQAVIHLVGIIREFPGREISFERLHVDATAAILAATKQAGIRRYLHMSANGTRQQAVSNYHQTKWRAEELVRNSDLDWTIFRPSLIYGREDQFISMLVRFIRLLPLVPVIGDGQYRLQPVPVEQIASGFASALDKPVALHKTYHCGGADCLSYNQVLDLVAAAIGKRPPLKLRQPLCLMRPTVSLLQRFPFFPLTSDQLQMLVEGNCCDTRDWLQDLELKPQPLHEGLEYLSA